MYSTAVCCTAVMLYTVLVAARPSNGSLELMYRTGEIPPKAAAASPLGAVFFKQTEVSGVSPEKGPAASPLDAVFSRLTE
ncbi:Hypothetical predicted protein, partial [Olea europaea subsp. europaea]